MDNSVVTTISSCTGPYALYKVEKYSRKESRKVKFSYNQAMGGVNQWKLMDLAFKERNGGHIFLIPWVFL